MFARRSTKKARKTREEKERERAELRSLEIEKQLQQEKLRDAQNLRDELKDLQELLQLHAQTPDITLGFHVELAQHRFYQLNAEAEEALIREAPTQPEQPPLPSQAPASPPVPASTPAPAPARAAGMMDFAPPDLEGLLRFCHHLEDPLLQQTPHPRGCPTATDRTVPEGAGKGAKRPSARGRRRTHRHPPTCAVM